MTEPVTSDEFARLMAPFAVPDGARVAVAVSGGADSLALTLLAAAWARARGVHLSALTVDHGLRAASAAEALEVAAWLAQAGVAHETLVWDEGRAAAAKTSGAVQARAREARYRLLGAWCRAHGAPWLLAAHHQGDQAETFLMRLRRASTLFGLAAMAPARDLGQGVTLCRPLLDIPKARLEATLRALGQPWIEDPSNADPAFERVRVRALLAGLEGEGVTAARLAGAARAARAVTQVIERALRAFEAEAVRPRPQGGVTVAGGAWAALPRVARERALARLVQSVGGGTYPPSPDKLARLADWLAGEGGARASSSRTLGGCVVRRRKGGFSVAPEAPRRPTSAIV